VIGQLIRQAKFSQIDFRRGIKVIISDSVQTAVSY